jgi:hypothetical protein
MTAGARTMPHRLRRAASFPSRGAAAMMGRPMNLAEQPLQWSVVAQPGGFTVFFTGDIDERSQFGDLATRLTGSVQLHLGKVRRISSFGIRNWMTFVASLTGAKEMALANCPPAFVRAMNMIHSVRGTARVRSFLAPYSCAGCGAESLELLQPAVHFPGRNLEAVPAFNCRRCGQPMAFDDVPSDYLAFLVRR